MKKEELTEVTRKPFTELEFENFMQVTDITDIKMFREGRLLYIEHPTKGIRIVDSRMFIHTRELTEDCKKMFNFL